MRLIQRNRPGRARRRPLPAGHDRLKSLVLAVAIFVAGWVVAVAVAGLPR
jgi:hypothetical protein